MAVAERPGAGLNIDVYNPDNYVAGVPHEEFRRLRDEAPLYWHSYPDLENGEGSDDGYWVVTRHEDVKTVAKDNRRFSAQRGFVLVDDLPADVLPMAQGQLLGMDPPNHGPIRKAVIERFTTKRLQALEPMIRQRAVEAMEAAKARAAKGEVVNFVFDVAGDLPTAVICSMLDVPREQWPQIRHWSDLQTAAGDPDLSGTPEEVQQASIEMGTYGYMLAAERKDQGGEDLISLLVNVEVEGRKVTEEEFASLFVQIAVAGNETTRGLLSTGMYELLQRPEDYAYLQQNPEALPAAVEEMLRWSTPLHYFRRTATEDVELLGHTIRENERIVMMYSSANFDERVFENPHDFDIRREKNPHLGFGFGIHLCLGANLARMEARIFFEEFFKHFAAIELAGEPQRIRSNMVNGFKQMPVKLTPR